MKSKKFKELRTYGYVKKEEDGRFVAICINLSLISHGESPEEALKKLMTEIDVYISHVLKNHDDDWEYYTNRFAPEEFIEEFTEGLECLKNEIDNRQKHIPLKRNKHRKDCFVQAFSSPYTQASL